MFSKSLVAAVTVLVCLSVCDALQCTGGVDTKMSGRCELKCGERERCLCAKDATPSNITGCLQQCVKHPVMNDQNITVNKCPDMQCTDLDHCTQTCSHGECGMQCKAKIACSQTCSAACTKMICSSVNCIQSCKNCKMECQSGVKSCQHQCLGGTCQSVCHADECNRSCAPPPGEKCEFKVIASAGDNLSALSLIKIMLMFLFAIKSTVM